MKCQWFKCGRCFQPTTHNKRFCGPKCAVDEGNWRAMRGKTIVPTLMLWRRARHWSKEDRRAWEIANNDSLPSISLIARLVDAWIAEQREGAPCP